MDHEDKLQGYGMLTAITQRTLNEELKRCFELGYVPTTVAQELRGAENPLDPDPVEVSLRANLSAPSIQIQYGSENRQEVLLCWNIGSGQLKTSSSQTALDIHDWTYAFHVPLAREVLSAEALRSRPDVPQVIKDRIGSLGGDGIEVSLIHLDFRDQGIDIANYVVDASSCPVPADLGGGSLFDARWASTLVELQNCIFAHFESKEASDTSYILGYIVTVEDPSRDFISLPLFNPSGCDFTTSKNEDDPDLSTLNLLLVTNGDPLPTAMGAGLYPSWVTKAGAQARLVVGERLLLERWILDKITRAFAWTVAEGKLDEIDRVADDEGWQVSCNVTKDWEHGSITYHEEKQRSIRVALTTGVENVARITLKGEYRDLLEFHDALLAKGSMSASQSWSIEVSLAVDEAGTISTTVESTIGAPVVGSPDANTAMKILNALMLGQLEQQMKQESGDWAAHEHELAACLGDQLSTKLTSRLLLPSGLPVQVKGFELDDAGDLLIDFDFDSGLA